jgi:phenylacetate-CoA ligase
MIRARLQTAFDATLCEAMGIGDISISLWGECRMQNGMHFCGGDFVHVELIDPATENTVAMTDGAQGEVVYTALRREAVPLLHFCSRDHVVVQTGACSCGRRTMRGRCIGRTDDLLIVRGVNMFPSALRSVVAEFSPQVTGAISVRPKTRGVRQEPPLPVVVELASGVEAGEGLAHAIEQSIRARLIVGTRVEFVPHGALPRSEYKTKLVDFDSAGS